jgi:hypothetical protein
MADSTITPVTEWPDYNVDPTGGDPIIKDLNALYDKVLQLTNPSTSSILIQGRATG